MYDWFTAKREYHASRFKVALAVLEQMAVEKEYPDEAAEVQRWLGRCQIELKQWADAVGSLSRAIELDPASAEGYRLRAMAYEGQGKTQEAAADTAKSRELRGRGRR
jgi:Flp pilus assembly protein TadD